MVKEDLTQGSEHRVQYTDDFSQNRTLATYSKYVINLCHPSQCNDKKLKNNKKNRKLNKLSDLPKVTQLARCS